MKFLKIMLQLAKYSEEWFVKWEDFIQDSINGNFLHSRKFYDHNPANRIDDSSFIFLKKKKIAAVLPCTLYEKNGKKILHSHLRSTYGGFVVNNEIGTAEALNMVELLIEQSKDLNVNELIIRNPFRIFNKDSCDESDYAMWFYGFLIKYREIEIAIKLGDKRIVQSRYSDSTKRSLNKAKKYLIVEESSEFEEYWSILSKNLSDKYNVSPTHNYESFLVLLKNIGNEKIKLFVAKLNDKIIGGAVVFILNKNALHAQYIASDMAFQEFRPLNIIIDYIVDWACAQNYKYFNLGMANEHGGRTINSGLVRFKEGFGGRGVLRETMHLQLNGSQIG